MFYILYYTESVSILFKGKFLCFILQFYFIYMELFQKYASKNQAYYINFKIWKEI